MDDKHVIINTDLDHAITVQQVLQEWLRYHADTWQDKTEIFRLIDEFDDQIHDAIWSPDYE